MSQADVDQVRATKEVAKQLEQIAFWLEQIFRYGIADRKEGL